MPLAVLGSFIGPFRLLLAQGKGDFDDFLRKDIEWAVKQGYSCKKLLLAVPFETLLYNDLEGIRRELAISAYNNKR